MTVIKVVPHPPEVLDLTQEQIDQLKNRLKEAKNATSTKYSTSSN
jgi:aromatic ring-opening dioxygenase LigB subunit